MELQLKDLELLPQLRRRQRHVEFLAFVKTILPPKEITDNGAWVNYNLGMLVNIVVGVLGVILFLFVFWKRLKDDYSSDIIFRVAASILLGDVLGLITSKFIFHQYFFWLSLLGAFLGMLIMIFRLKLRFFETFEALILGALPGISLMFFKDSIINSSLSSFLAFVISLILIFAAYWFDMNYKSFTWYKSGKIGFAGILTATIFFLIRTVVAIKGIPVISFVVSIEPMISGLVTIVLVGLLINLGRNKE